MSRLTVSSCLPAEYAERISDVEDRISPREEREHQIDLDRQAEDAIRSEEWWEDVLCGVNEIERVLPGALARMMANLDGACKGESIGQDAITTALSQAQRVARDMARREIERDD